MSQNEPENWQVVCSNCGFQSEVLSAYHYAAIIDIKVAHELRFVGHNLLIRQVNDLGLRPTGQTTLD